jgi:hypothetical protein
MAFCHLTEHAKVGTGLALPLPGTCGPKQTSTPLSLSFCLNYGREMVPCHQPEVDNMFSRPGSPSPVFCFYKWGTEAQ